MRFLGMEMRLKANELAALLGVHKVTVSRWENNEENIGPSSDRLLRSIYATRRIEELASHLGKLGGEKVSEDIRHDVRQIEDHAKAIKRTMVKRRPIAIDLAKLRLSHTFDPDGEFEKVRESTPTHLIGKPIP
jgi:transcriptional regulator with XRE-family HTH domain